MSDVENLHNVIQIYFTKSALTINFYNLDANWLAPKIRQSKLTKWTIKISIRYHEAREEAERVKMLPRIAANLNLNSSSISQQCTWGITKI